MLLSKTITFKTPPKCIKIKHFGEPMLYWTQVQAREKELQERLEEEQKIALQAEKKKLEALQEQLFSTIQKRLDDLIEDIHLNIPKIVIALTKKIISGITIDENVIKSNIEEVLSQLSEDSGYMELLLSYQDWETMSQNGEEWMKKYSKISFIKDEKLLSGDFLLKSRFGIIDARIEKKLEKVARELIPQ